MGVEKVRLKTTGKSTVLVHPENKADVQELEEYTALTHGMAIEKACAFAMKESDDELSGWLYKRGLEAEVTDSGSRAIDVDLLISKLCVDISGSCKKKKEKRKDSKK